MPLDRPRLPALVLTAIAYLLLKALLYRAAGLFDVAPNASAWYPPIGLMLAFVLHSGPAAIPFLFIPSDLLTYGTVTSYSLLIIPQAIIVGAAGLLLRRWSGESPLGSAKDVIIFIAVAVAAETLLFVASTAAVQAITARNISIAGNLNFAYWLGDMSGMLLCTPVFLAVFHITRPSGGPAGPWIMPGAQTALRAAGLSAAALLAWFLSHDLLSTPASSYFLLILPISAAGFLWGFGASTLTAFLVNGGLVLLMHDRLGTAEAIDLQVFMLAAGATGLLLGALGSTRTELLGRNAQLAHAIEAAPLGIALLERQAGGVQVAFANRAFLRFNADAAPIIQRLRPGEGFEGDMEVDGRTFNWTVKRATASPSGETLIAIQQDVTEQRRREKAEQHQRRMAAIGEIAGGLAHELNNLLHPVINLSQQARREAGLEIVPASVRRPERLEKALAIIEESARNSARLVRQVLSFARNDEEGDGGTELVGALRDVVALLTATLPPSFTIAMTSDTAAVRVRLTRTELSQIVTNLVVNALDATGQRGRLSLHIGRPADGAVTVTVEDDGPGIPAGNADRVMEPFFTTKPHGQGTGLGLAVVRDLLLRRNATIALVTRAPQGARFVLTLAEHC
ncbi:ATP-binding protein [Azospirillum picis]|uniref:histidine kinase n=1 Tax=Azospirillum picis TaxID=488438 RepID=A0ABU0MHY6_9PROT|nr:ATP-binding protein [Azospirillum picis]MBP2298927.1 signal transduction histidine kinase [Azospirillum picis]MDQ0532831.1 signal transduction histidine kinase [Azospirillum picis]